MGLSESRKKKLSILTQSIAKGDFAAAGQVLRGLEKRMAPKPTEFAIISDAAPMTLEEACPGCEKHVASPTGCQPYWFLERPLAEISTDHLAIARKYDAVLRGAGQRLDELKASVALCHVASARPEDLLFMDIECCGLTSATIFLIGTMFYADGQLIFHQYLARDYAQEAAVLRAFADRYAAAGILVTFNGKAFDMNMIKDRSVFHGLAPLDRQAPHLDLLQEARKRWRGRLPNCKLQTLEANLCGRHRVGDIPGWAIADAYHRYVDSGDARQIRDIVHHNTLDLLTMAEVLCHVLTGTEP